MSKIIFKFDLSGDDGIEEERAANRCFKALDMAIALHEIQEYLRVEVDRANVREASEAYNQAIQVQNRCTMIIEYHGIDIEELLV